MGPLMNVQLASRARAVDGTEMWFLRSVDVAALPFVGMTLRVGELFLNVVSVHLEVDTGLYVVAVGDDTPTPIAEAPKNRAELAAFCASRFKGWDAMPSAPHLRVVE